MKNSNLYQMINNINNINSYLIEDFLRLVSNQSTQGGPNKSMSIKLKLLNVNVRNKVAT